MEHDLALFAAPPAGARLYVAPCGFVDGPLSDPAAARQLAGGAVWFSQVQLILRAGTTRVSSLVLPVRDQLIWQGRLAAELQEGFACSWRNLTSQRPALEVGGKVLRFVRPQVMGILNVTPDSFSDGGRFANPHDAVAAAHAMMSDGAALVDCGAESTRPGAKPVWEGDEILRLQPVLEALKGSSSWISADTRKANVMRMALAAGAQIINDVSALSHEPGSLEVVVQAQCPVVLMHMQGDPQSMQRAPDYADALLDVYDWLEARRDACRAAGIDPARILLDPGIGFGKSLRHNLELLNGLGLFHALGCPLLLGVSRKRFIGALSQEEGPEDRFAGSLAAALHGLNQGVQILRVHDVAQTVQAVKVWQGLRDAAITPR